MRVSQERIAESSEAIRASTYLMEDGVHYGLMTRHKLGWFKHKPSYDGFTSTDRVAEMSHQAFPGLEFSHSRSGFDDKFINDTISAHINEELLRELIGEHDYPVNAEVIAKALRLDYRLDKTPFQEASAAMMEKFRDAGMLEACPNISCRGVTAYQAWNDWVQGEPKEKYGYRSFENTIARTYAFSAFENTTLRAFSSMRVYMTPRDKDGKHLRDEDVMLEAADVDQLISDILADLKEVFMDPEISKMKVYETSLDTECSVTGRKVHTLGSTFSPVLGGPNPEKGYAFEVFEDLDVPKVAQHLVLPLRSGKIIASSDYRYIHGFQEGLETLFEDYHEMGNAEGMDQMVEDYFAKAGLVRIFTTRSPSAYREDDGLWRVGHVDEDSDHFYDGDERNDEIMPEPEWQVETGVWANIIADPETIKDIVFASGEYQTREDAAAAFDAFVEEHGDASPVVDIDAEELHVYMPTGYGLREAGGFIDKFRAEGIDVPEWREDSYMLSTRPLTVDPELIIDRPYEAAVPVQDSEVDVEETPSP
jgi:hypothetical protein